MLELRRASRRGSARGLVGLTFDDGYDNFLFSALPVLDSFGFSAIVFVVDGMLGQQNDWKHFYEPRPQLELISASGVREISERGMEVGSHSMSHARLDEVHPEQPQSEVIDSRTILSEVVGALGRPMALARGSGTSHRGPYPQPDPGAQGV
jgi:peptidoglycan/xylan/chitin deacetylase (PgdA/CDA1 family)